MGGLGCVIVLGLGIFGVDSFVNPEMKEVSMQFVNDQHTKHLVVAKSEQITAPEETKGQSYGGTGNQAVEGINGDWKTDAVNGFRVAWAYISNVYETGGGNLATVQEHDGCTCTPDNYDVPRTYGSSSVAFGPFQMDSKYSASNFFTYMRDAGYTGFDNLVGLTNEQYMTYEIRKQAHGSMLKAQYEGYTRFFMNCVNQAAQAGYLSEKTIQALESSTGLNRYDIPEGIMGWVFSNNIWLGSSFGDKYAKNINPSMTQEQWVDTLYSTALTIAQKYKKNPEERLDKEKQLVLTMLQGDYNGYEPHEVPGKGLVSWGKDLQIPGY